MSNYIILNGLSLRGNGHLRDNWDKFVQFEKTFLKLKDIGVSKIVVPNDINNLRFCGFCLMDAYSQNNQELYLGYKQELLSLTKYFRRLRTLPEIDQLSHVFGNEDGCSYLLPRCIQENISCISFLFRDLYQNASIEGKYTERNKITDERIQNIISPDDVSPSVLPIVISKSEARHRKPLDEPLWNVDKAKDYRKKINFSSKVILDHPSEKIRILTKVATDIANINGWVKDENVSSLNSNDGQIREIFVSKYFSETNCYLSIDFEKPEVYYELHNCRGEHKGQIKWDGTEKDNPDKTGGHNIKVG